MSSTIQFFFLACVVARVLGSYSTYTLQDGVPTSTEVEQSTNLTAQFVFTFPSGPSVNNRVYINISYLEYVNSVVDIVVFDYDTNSTDPTGALYYEKQAHYPVPVTFNFSAVNGATYYLNFFNWAEEDGDITLVAHASYGTCQNSCNKRGLCINSICQCDFGFFGDYCQNNCPTACNGLGTCIGNSQCACNASYIGTDCGCPSSGTINLGDSLLYPQGWYNINVSSFPAGAIFQVTNPVANSETIIFGSAQSCPLVSYGNDWNTGSLNVPACKMTTGSYVISLDYSFSGTTNITLTASSAGTLLTLGYTGIVSPTFFGTTYAVDIPTAGDFYVILQVIGSGNDEVGCYYQISVSKNHCPTDSADVTSGSAGCGTGLVYAKYASATPGRYYVFLQSGLQSPITADFSISKTAPSGATSSTGPTKLTSDVPPGPSPPGGSFLYQALLVSLVMVGGVLVGF